MELTKEEKAARFDEVVEAVRCCREMIKNSGDKETTAFVAAWFTDKGQEIVDRPPVVRPAPASDAPEPSETPPAPTLTDQEIRLKAVELALEYRRLAMKYKRDAAIVDVIEVADTFRRYIEAGET